MWIEPNSEVRILHNVPLDIDYTNTLYFTDKTAQANYFMSQTKVIGTTPLVFNKVSYQRIEREYIKLDINAGDLYDCNYMMFKNTSFENKWFYAFITRVDYVANKTARITYVIDSLQSWFWDGAMLHSFVRREHIVNDAFGANLVPESIAPLNYFVTEKADMIDFSVQAVVLACSEIVINKYPNFPFKAGMNVINNIGSGIFYIYYKFRFNDNTDPDPWNIGVPVETRAGAFGKMKDAITQLIKAVGENSQDRILALFQCPSFYLSQYAHIDVTDPDLDFGDPETNPFSVPVYITNGFGYTTTIARPTTLGSYGEPHNYKLLTSPYSTMLVTDSRGQTAEYPYECFINPNNEFVTPQFRFEGALNCDPSCLIEPANFNGALYDQTNALILKGYPQCSINIDMFKAYLASNGGVIPTLAKDLISPIARDVMGAANNAGQSMQAQDRILQNYLGGQLSATNAKANMALANANLIATGVSLASNIASDIGSFTAKANVASQVLGNKNGDVIYSAGYYAPQYMKICLKEEFAKIADDYFDRYGYATNEMKIPNISSRPHWNYVEVTNLNFIGNIPQDDIENIKTIFNKGITFWKNPAEVGLYYLDNWTASHQV